jgi:LAGLIDADG endonuclease
LNPYWVAGFVSGDGSFSVTVCKDTRNNTGFRVDPRFSVGLNSRDANLIENLAKIFNCGVIFISKDRPVIHFTVGKLGDITNVILPIFYNYPVQGVKSLDFFDFSRIISLVNNKEQLTENGFKKIQKIVLNMNQRRTP